MIDFKKKMQELDKLEGKTQTDDTKDELLLDSQKRKKITTYVIAILVVALVFSGKIIMSSQNANDWLSGIGLFNKIRQFVPAADKQLVGEENDRVNILLLGMGGKNHDGAYLTDTIMLASLKPSTKQLSLISIPRDLTTPESGWKKINSVNAYAEMKSPGSGGTVTTQAIADLLQEPTTYYIRADFTGFERIIDEIGGVEINVENSFDDYSYPVDGQEDNPNYYSRYEHLHFDAGLQKMDGATALKYARSRHALGPEGSDFARAKRQQLVLEAVKEKLLSSQTLLNPTILAKLISEFDQDISTNLNTWEIIRLWSLVKDIPKDQIISKVLSDAPDGLLVSGKGEDGAYILTPRSGNFSEIRNMVQTIFDSTTATTTKETVEPITDNAKVFITNGTWVAGLASKTSSTLEHYDFKVIGTSNAVERNYQQTVIYDLSSGEKNESLATLKTLTGATQAFNSPSWLEQYKTGDNKSDFLLILGTDANKE
jgi:LCP family protein required for cell wall assembly